MLVLAIIVLFIFIKILVNIWVKYILELLPLILKHWFSTDKFLYKFCMFLKIFSFFKNRNILEVSVIF